MAPEQTSYIHVNCMVDCIRRINLRNCGRLQVIVGGDLAVNTELTPTEDLVARKGVDGRSSLTAIESCIKVF